MLTCKCLGSRETEELQAHIMRTGTTSKPVSVQAGSRVFSYLVAVYNMQPYQGHGRHWQRLLGPGARP